MYWGQGSNNEIYWGQGNLVNGWGMIYASSWNGDTILYKDEIIDDGLYELTDGSDNILNDGTNDLIIEFI